MSTSAMEDRIVDSLRRKGVVIVREDGEHEIGGEVRHLVVGRKGDDGEEFEAVGDTRLNALRGLYIHPFGDS